MSDPDFSATVERFTGFGALYDRMRLSEESLGIDPLREAAERAFGASSSRWLWSPRPDRRSIRLARGNYPRGRP
jgi:hypothetical protein